MQVTEKISGFGGIGHLTPCISLSKVRIHLDSSFGSSFLQIRHWHIIGCFLLFGNHYMFLQAPLLSPISSLLSRPERDLHPLVVNHADRTNGRYAVKPLTFSYCSACKLKKMKALLSFCGAVSRIFNF